MGHSRRNVKGSNTERSATGRKPNPFDLVFKKSQVSGKSIITATKRQSFEIRKRTIGVEYANHGKANKIVDKRLAERDAGLSAAEKAEKRFILQRKQLFSKKKSVFNLDDDENNNGHGTDEEEDGGFFPLDKGEKFNLRKRVERDDGVDGELDSELVALANFGGGKFEDDKRAENLTTGSAKRSEILANLISASKQAKAIRQMERDAQADNTERLNELFDRLKHKGVLQITTNLRSSAAPVILVDTRTESHSYDNLYRELLHADTGKKAAATKILTNVESPAELDTLIAEFERAFQSSTSENLKLITDIAVKTFNHAKVRPYLCAQRLLALVESHRKRCIESAKSNPEFGGVDFASIAIVRIIGRIFSITDRFHVVATPTFIFATELLTRSRVRNTQHAAQLIFLCDSLADWVSTSKRYIPEVIGFLRGCLLMCVDNSDDEKFPTVSFPITAPFRRMLYEETKTTSIDVDSISVTKLFTSDTEKAVLDSLTKSPSKRGHRKSKNVISESVWSWNSGEARLTTIRALLATIRRFVELYSTHTVSAYAIYRPFLVLLKRLPTNNFPPKMAEYVQKLIEFMENKLETAPQLTQLKLPIRNIIRQVEMLEPRFDDHFNPNHSKFDNAGDAGGNAARKARKREQVMRQRLRKETRGAMKELRTDAKFIAKLQSERAQKISKERRDKTKRILAGLQTQESEYKKRTLKKY